jgi:hypothetical protein
LSDGVAMKMVFDHYRYTSFGVGSMSRVGTVWPVAPSGHFPKNVIKVE